MTRQVPWRLLHGTLLLKKNKDLFSKALCCCLQEIVDFINIRKHTEHHANERLVPSQTVVDIGLNDVSCMRNFAYAPVVSREIEHQAVRARINLILMELLVPLVEKIDQRGSTNIKLRRRANRHTILQIVDENLIGTLGVENHDHFSHF